MKLDTDSASLIKYGAFALHALEGKGHFPPVLGGDQWDRFTQQLRPQDRLEFALRSARSYPGSIGLAFALFTEPVLWEVRGTRRELLEANLQPPSTEDPELLHAEACKLLKFECSASVSSLAGLHPKESDRIIELSGGAGLGSLTLLVSNPHLRPQSNFRLLSSNTVERTLMAFAISLIAGDVVPPPILEALPEGAHFTYLLDWGKSASPPGLHAEKRIAL